jgi:hypothetical protein
VELVDLSPSGRRRMVIAAILAAFLAGDAVVPAVFPPWSSGDLWAEGVSVMSMGAVVGQINLIAIWAAMAMGNVFLRLPWAMLLTVLMWYGIVLGNRVGTYGPNFNDACVLGCILFEGVIAAQIPLWIASRLFRWRLAAERVEAQEGPLQFRIAHLLLGMVFLSVALSLGRVVLPEGEFTGRGFFYWNAVLPLTLMAVVNLLVELPCIWMAFLPAARMGRFLLGWPVYTAAITGGEFLGMTALEGHLATDTWKPCLGVYLFNLIQGLTVLVVLGTLRAVGFQLLRVPRVGAVDAPSQKEDDPQAKVPLSVDG